MDVDIHNVQRIRELQETYKDLTDELNKAVEELSLAKNVMIIKDSNVKKTMNQIALIKEEIMCEKKIFDALRR